ncbi:MAG: BrnA antitoxin family protein [Nitrospinae bacterium]|nr:BrnA antitoxin family protein [Nitrospinota bacterium]
MKKLKKIPILKNEDSEREFWDSHDVTDYVNFSKARPMVLPNLKPSTESISLRMPKHLLERVKMLANRADIPYQSFIKELLAEEVAKRMSRTRNIPAKN